ncbi:MAG: (d)CMP kinase [Pseudomonadota bacterium]
MGFCVAIDGPAASGKGTLAHRIAETYGFHHLDTGLTYRAVAKALLDAGTQLDDVLSATEIADALDLGALDRAVLSDHKIGEAASRIAVIPAVRKALVAAQRRYAQREPGSVLDGRDIGTVVCPDAPVKLFVTASPEVRARRRLAEVRLADNDASYDAVLADLLKRDARDSQRADSPLRPSVDAHLLDTSEMDIEAAFLAAKRLIDAVQNARDNT